jgi:hypothetical protein
MIMITKMVYRYDTKFVNVSTRCIIVTSHREFNNESSMSYVYLHYNDVLYYITISLRMCEA